MYQVSYITTRLHVLVRLVRSSRVLTTITNYYQLLSTIINYYQPLSSRTVLLDNSRLGVRSCPPHHIITRVFTQ